MCVKYVVTKVSCSIGVAISDVRFQTEDALCKAADIALYDAKRNCRNRYRTYTSETVVPEQGAVAKESRSEIGGALPTTSAVCSADGR